MLDEATFAPSATSPPIDLCELPDGGYEPRIRDVDLAERLGFAKPLAIRQIIERNRAELATYGDISVTVTETSAKGGRPGKAYWLTEGQALVVCALSRTSRAAMVRKLVIEVFMGWRIAQIGGRVREHTRRPPTPKPASPRLEHRVAMTPTADPGVMRVTADLPLSVASDLMTLFATYETKIATGLARPAH